MAKLFAAAGIDRARTALQRLKHCKKGFAITGSKPLLNNNKPLLNNKEEADDADEHAGPIERS
jgi:hypothetical protein